MARGYETLMSGLELADRSRPLKKLLITSTQPAEGKTTVTINLAVTMGLAGRRVLIIDADLRKPRIHTLLGLENARGFADILAGAVEAEDVIELEQAVYFDAEAVDNKQPVRVITSGPASPAAFKALGSARLAAALTSLTTVYDVVLLDSPPVLSVNDALLLAPLVDGVLLVMNAGRVVEKDLTRARDWLQRTRAQLLGVAMNRFEEALHGPGLHPYRSYYE